MQKTSSVLVRAVSFFSSRCLLDWFERVAVASLLGWLIWRSTTGFLSGGQWANLLLVPAEGAVVFFMIFRRQTDKVSLRPHEWLLAFLATASPLMVSPIEGLGFVSPLVGATFLMSGIAVQLLAKLTLGRSYGVIPANRGLKLTGLYRFVRHPIYAGYLLGHIGFLLMNPTAWNLAAYVICYSLQIPRLLAEERILGQDAEYQQYQTRVRYRLLPKVF